MMERAKMKLEVTSTPPDAKGYKLFDARWVEIPYTILTMDPSYTHWGWAVVDQEGKILKVGCIITGRETKKRRIRTGDDDTRRINEINLTLLEIIKKWNVGYILGELPHGSQSAVSAKSQGIVAAIGQGLSDHLGIGIEWYSEADTKKCVLNKRSATKEEMIEAIDKLYKVPWMCKSTYDEHIADAIAVYYTASKQSSTLKLIKNGNHS